MALFSKTSLDLSRCDARYLLKPFHHNSSIAPQTLVDEKRSFVTSFSLVSRRRRRCRCVDVNISITAYLVLRYINQVSSVTFILTYLGRTQISLTDLFHRAPQIDLNCRLSLKTLTHIFVPF